MYDSSSSCQFPDIWIHVADALFQYGLTGLLASAGLVLMQLAIPKLRSAGGIKQFNQQFKKARFDLQVWRERERLPRRETAILDAEGSAGWDLAASLLRPRDIQVNPSNLHFIMVIAANGIRGCS